MPSQVAIAASTLLVSGCRSMPQIEQSDTISTVFTVRWSEPGATEGWVELGEDGDLDRVFDATQTGDGDFEALLLGLAPSSTYRLRTLALAGDALVEGEVQSIVTGAPPATLPAYKLSGDATGRGGYTLASWYTAPQPATIVLDDEGRYVWWHSDVNELYSMRSLLSADGRSILYNIFHNVGLDGTRQIVRVGLDGTEIERIDTPYHHHDFAELPDGTLAWIAYDLREVDGVQVPGDRIVELDADGQQTDVWSAWDHFEWAGDLDELGMWTHANALDYVEEDDAWLLSLHNLDALVEIDRTSGEILWQLGGEGADLVADDGFVDQHQSALDGDRLLVFDNGRARDLSSRVVEYELDLLAATATATWSYRPDPDIYVVIGGDVTRLDSGDTLVTMSSAGRMQQVTPEGEVAWDLTVDVGTGFGYTTWYESLYR